MTLTPEPILYSFRRCPYAMRARLALAVSGTWVELREVRLSAKPAEMLTASPKGTVPVLVLPGGAVIDESLAIMRWALAIADPEDWLERADGALIAANDGPFKAALDRYKYPQRYDVDPLPHRALSLYFLREIDWLIAAGGRIGERRGLTDAAIVPFVRQFAAVEPNWFDAQPLPRLRPWLADYLGSDLFGSIMLRESVPSPAPRATPRR